MGLMSYILKNKLVETRKEHRCWGCEERFQKGSEMRNVVSVDSSREIMSAYYCEKCSDFIDSLPNDEFEDGIGFGDLLNYEEYKDFKKINKK
jgi:hypothetical protein